MRRHAAVLALVLAVGSLSACAEYTTTGVPQETSAGPTESAGAGEQGTLAGTTWTLTDSSMSEASLTQFTITAEFTEDSMAGQAPVNTYSTSYQVEGNQIEFGPVAATMMAGEPQATSAEGAYFALLSTVTGFEQTAEELILTAGEEPVLMFQAGTPAVDPAADELAATQAVADSVVGLTLVEAKKTVEDAGMTLRVTSKDGTMLPATMDYRTDRVNVALVDGSVESVTVG